MQKISFHSLNNEIICNSDDNCIEGYRYKNPDTKECYLSLDDCLSKGNAYFFNNFCYTTQCPNDNLVSLSSKSEDIMKYYKQTLLLDDNLKDKICICTTNAWSNITSDNVNFFQECLTECPEGYEPESLTHQCIIKGGGLPTTNILEQIATIEIIEPTEIKIVTTEINIEEITNIESITLKEITTEEKVIVTEAKEIEKATEIKEIKSESKEFDSEEKISEKTIKIVYPEEYYKNPNYCQAIYENECLSSCPEDTCLTQIDPALVTCIQIEENVKVFNDICFDNLNDYTNNIKKFAENNTSITTELGITIHGYSTKSVDEEIEKDVSYSLVYLGECEDKLRKYYKIPDYVDIFIFGIDTPNKNKSYVTTVYNYEVYLDNGTQLDYLDVCDGTKISISSANSFFTDVCSPVSIDGNDITLEDRKKYFSTSNISLCNESCYYSSINYTTKRFTCECYTIYNYIENNNNEKEEEGNYMNYREYFLSFINYKIAICYKVFLKFSNYYYNAGFYIAIVTTLLCLCGMVIFLKWGIKDLNEQIFEHIPNRLKLRKKMKEKEKKFRRKITAKTTKFNKNNPPKNIKLKTVRVSNIKDLKKKKSFNLEKTKRMDNSKMKTLKRLKSQTIKKIINDNNLKKSIDEKQKKSSKLIDNKNEFTDRKKYKYKSQIININKIQIKRLNITNSNKSQKKVTNYFNNNKCK